MAFAKYLLKDGEKTAGDPGWFRWLRRRRQNSREDVFTDIGEVDAPESPEPVPKFSSKYEYPRIQAEVDGLPCCGTLNPDDVPTMQVDLSIDICPSRLEILFGLDPEDKAFLKAHRRQDMIPPFSFKFRVQQAIRKFRKHKIGPMVGYVGGPGARFLP